MGTPVKSNTSEAAVLSAASLQGGNGLPRLEETVLLAHVLGVSRTAVLAHPETPVAANVAERYRSLVARRQAGEPIAYLVGTREFYGLALRVCPDVLIPRPETELLVDAALERLPAGRDLRVLDLGTGSGAIALAIALQRPAAAVTASDNSAAALAIAAENARTYGITNATLIQSDWFEAIEPVRFDMIVSNPPYVRAADPHLCEGDLRFEPGAALVSGDDGLDAARTIIGGARSRLVDGGWLLLEHGFDQGERCRRLLQDAGFVEVSTLRDLAGHERTSIGRSSAIDAQTVLRPPR